MPLYRSQELGNFELNPAFTGASAAVVLPVQVQGQLALPKKYKPYIGAYPVK
jgi:hypothetical protein